MSQVDLTATAQRDLDDIWDYIAAHNLDAADRAIDKIDLVSHQIARLPNIGIKCDDLSQGLRKFPVRPYEYVLFYRPIEDGIRLIRVLHGRRDLPAVFRDEPQSNNRHRFVCLSRELWDNSKSRAWQIRA